MNYLISRLEEASTWQGLIMMVTSTLHLTISENLDSAIIAAGVGLAGLLAAALPDKLGAPEDATH